MKNGLYVYLSVTLFFLRFHPVSIGAEAPQKNYHGSVVKLPTTGPIPLGVSLPDGSRRETV